MATKTTDVIGTPRKYCTPERNNSSSPKPAQKERNKASPQFKFMERTKSSILFGSLSKTGALSSNKAKIPNMNPNSRPRPILRIETFSN